LQSQLLPEALTVARDIQTERYRAQALSALAEKISQTQKNKLFDLWRDNLPILSLRTRPDLLADIKA